MPPALVCLRCGLPMRRLMRQRVEVDECPDCLGTWLDQSELATLVGSWNDLPRTGMAVKNTGAVARCPRCDCGLERRTYSENQRIIVDRCPSCSGIWLDRGELDLILNEVYG